MPDEQLYRVTGPRFVAGFLVREHNGVPWVIEAAPILSTWVGRPLEGIQQECERRGWRCEPVDETDPLMGAK